MDTKDQQHSPLRANKKFRFLCIGSIISMLGDQLTLITLPWLALFLSPEPWVVGSIMAVMALPMSVFMLFGGAIVDRYSAKRILLASKYFNGILMALLAILIYNNLLTLPLLYVIVFLIGTYSAFAIPAGSSLLPQIVHPTELPIANSIGMSLRSLTTIVGPLLAAVLLALEFSNLSETKGTQPSNLTLIFIIDAASFFISAYLLKFIDIPAAKAKETGSIKQNIVLGLQHFWSLKDLRILMFYIALVTSFLGGLMQVGIPLLVNNQWQGGAELFGILMAMFAVGTIIGMFVAAKSAITRYLTLGLCVLLTDIIVGVLLMVMSRVSEAWQGIIILLLMGVLAGFVQVLFMSWVQQQAKRELLGRLMSIVMFGLVGLLPLGTALAGAVLQFVPVSSFFLVSGFTLSLIAILAMCFSDIPSVKSTRLPLQQN